MLGCINWLMVGLLQYDFIAGLFGFQASIFSRLCYIVIGVGAMYLLLRIIINKGTFKVFERKKKKKENQAQTQGSPTPATANVEASQEQVSKSNQQTSSQNQDNLFDEHFKEN